MRTARRPAKVLPFQPADVWARRGAETRLLELLAEAQEIESWLSEAEVRQQRWAASVVRRSSALALVKR